MDKHLPEASILYQFEQGFNPVHPERSRIRPTIIGSGEISVIFTLEQIPGWVFKRLPLFNTVSQAEAYREKYAQYLGYLQEAGIELPRETSFVVQHTRVVLYIAQEAFESSQFGHRLIHELPSNEALDVIHRTMQAIKRVWTYNQQHAPTVALGLDGQLSNWVIQGQRCIYVDTSTPLFKRAGQEQLDPELFLQSVPGILRWIIRQFFLEEVLERYYDLRSILIDLIANLYKEKKPSLIDDSIRIANRLLPEHSPPITRKDIDSYYRMDKFIWELFFWARAFQRWYVETIRQERYPFMLPQKVSR